MNLDGTDKQEIVEMGSSTFNIENNQLYYWKDNSIYCYDMTNSQNTVIMQDITDKFQVNNGVLYAVGNQNQLYKLHDNKEKVQIINELGKHFNVSNKQIYYIKPLNTAADPTHGNAYQTDLNGENEQKLCEDTIDNDSYLLICENILFATNGLTSDYIKID